MVPEAIAGIVRRCLEKPPERRFQSATDLGFALRAAVADPHVVGQRRRNRRPVAAVAIAGIILVAASAAYRWLRPGTYPMDLRPVPLTSLPDEEYYPSFSPDGNKVALTWNGEKGDNYGIYVKQIGSGTRPVRRSRLRMAQFGDPARSYRRTVRVLAGTAPISARFLSSPPHNVSVENNAKTGALKDIGKTPWGISERIVRSALKSAKLCAETQLGESAYGS